jgi:hypothetical protein
MYDEDQAKKQEEVDKIDEQIYRGKLEEQSGGNRYVPKSGINIHTEVGTGGPR